MTTPKKTIRSQFRVHKDGLEKIHRAAKILDLTISEFVRCTVIEKSMQVISSDLIIQNTESDAVRKVKGIMR